MIKWGAQGRERRMAHGNTLHRNFCSRFNFKEIKKNQGAGHKDLHWDKKRPFSASQSIGKMLPIPSCSWGKMMALHINDKCQCINFSLSAS